MKKLIATLLFINIFVALQAQKLENKIPNTSDIVVVADADNLFKLINISEIDNSFLGEEMLKVINRKREDKISSVGGAGIAIKSNAYYFFERTDSISYHTFLVKINDKARYQAMLKSRDLKKIKKEQGYSYIQKNSELMLWNNEFLVFVKGDKHRGYFKQYTERFEKLKQEGQSMYAVKKSLSKKWILQKGFSIATNGLLTSIAVNPSFQKAKKRNAVATLWVRNYGELIADVIGSLGRGLKTSIASLMPQNGENINGIETVTANLFFNKKNANLLLEMTVSDDMKKSFKKIYNQKMNSTLINSFNHDNALAFWSVSINTEQLLLEYPAMVDKMYGGMFPKFSQEISLVGDVLSLIIDEKAMASLVTGDALFVLNGFEKKQVSYKSYKYDDNYKRKEITKTKETLMPDFTFMMGSKEEKLLTKLFKLGQKHKLVKGVKNVFELDVKKAKLPFNVYAVIKNEVLYITNSKVRAIKLSLGKRSFKTRKHRKLIKKNSSVLFADVNALLAHLPKKSFRSTERKMIAFSNDNIQDVRFVVSKMKGNKIASKVELNTNGKQENTLKLLFDFINNVAK
ncbi:DUF4836 family protein [Tenacibaculum finnmarkense]|uniref:DUF4836 family protein n=1 Tax=Tenacibaculum finnmarkense TaxID=2781243 RepID=UPI001EFB89CA|nr:DUF4836 family protein [Tenacibaculum finnmarkense]MCG8733049.1 DUF4836 family protein [Tenacibaculum finnmarkense]